MCFQPYLKNFNVWAELPPPRVLCNSGSPGQLGLSTLETGGQKENYAT